MASTILADNGVSSGSAGLKSSADSTGVLALQTTTSGGTATTAVTVDNNQNVGVGVTPSAWISSAKAIQISSVGSVSANSNSIDLSLNRYVNSGGTSTYIASAAASLYEQYNGGHYWYQAASGTAGNPISFTQAMTLDASGNLGVGTTSPSRKLSLDGGAGTQTWTGYQQAGSEKFVVGLDASGNPTLNATISAPLIFKTNDTERARIDSSGNLLVNTTSQVGSGKLSVKYAGNAGDGIGIGDTTDTSGSYFIAFRNSSGTAVGSISRNGASNVAYNTSSDYRLKENIAPMTGALATVASLKPVTYTWKSDNSQGQGFIAHELQDIIPECVTGAKDAVDADGNPVYQGIDTSFLVATLTAAIQELNAKFEEYKAAHP